MPAPSAPPFLRALGLNLDANERAVRAAYARLLKGIDQASDVHGFQALREAYEAALRWARDQAAQSGERADSGLSHASAELPSISSHQAPDNTGYTPPTALARPVLEPVQLGDEVFASFAAHPSGEFTSEKEAEGALDAALADERLVNLEARERFEGRIAALLLNGWQPGHQFLFRPACARFQWDQDRRRLAHFGRLGAALNAAIEEKLLFFQQAPR